jgi:hypothetical protein
METTTAFDLNRAIQGWRESFAQSPAFERDHVDEMETHLRDSIASLQSRGLSEAEAFQIATQRLGGAEQLHGEFAKTNASTVWRQRAFWMLAGMLFWTVGADLISIAKSVGVCAGTWITTNGLLLGWVGGAVHLLAFAAVLVGFWRLASGQLGLPESGTRIFGQPKLFVALALVGLLVLEAGSALLFAFTFKRLDPIATGQRFAVEQWVAGILPVLKGIAMIGGLVWLQRRKFGKIAGSHTVTLTMLAVTLIAFSGSPAHASDTTQKPTAGKPAAATMAEAMKLWREGKQSDAVDKFLAVDFSKRPLFPTGSVLNLTEAEFIELPSAARDKMSKAMLDDIQTIKLIAGQVKELAKTPAKAAQCRSQLKAAGEAFDRPGGLALLKLVGQALKKMAATQP